MILEDPLRPNQTHFQQDRISLDGVVGRIEQHQGYHQSNGAPFGYPVAVNLQGPANVYDPDPGRLELPGVNYQPYEWEMPFHPTPQPLTPYLLEPEPEPQQLPDYNDCLMTNDLFARAMRELNG